MNQPAVEWDEALTEAWGLFGIHIMSLAAVRGYTQNQTEKSELPNSLFRPPEMPNHQIRY
jgi:hypothetical protein